MRKQHSHATEETSPTPDRCLGADELAAFLNVSRMSIWRLMKRGELPHHRLGGRIVFTPGDVTRLLARTGKQQGRAR